ncbi:MAG: hypothetical protein CL828_01130 [Crocinitomicaceae bacterium]|nr:hypothetical protein [Crocinitomicaceae bacterium]
MLKQVANACLPPKEVMNPGGSLHLASAVNVLLGGGAVPRYRPLVSVRHRNARKWSSPQKLSSAEAVASTAGFCAGALLLRRNHRC